jgi:hypothetical protein
MSNTVYSDLSGIFYVQQQYLADLAALAKDGNGSGALGYMQDLRTKLGNAYTAYQGASPSASAVLDRQSSMQDILNKEVNRLDTKKTSVDSAVYGQQRMAQFSNSYSKKYLAQIKILFIIIIVLIIYLGLTLLNNFIPVPDAVFIFVMLVIGTFALVVIVYTLKDINSRYNMDFDKLNFRAPTSNEIKGKVDGNISAGSGGLLCIGESCCPAGNPSGAVWDRNSQQCLSFNVSVASGSTPTTSGFSLMSQASLLDQAPNVSGQVSPYEPSEINSYTKI